MKYLIGFSYQETGRIVIEADTPEEAAEKLEGMLDDDGLPSDFDVTDGSGAGYSRLPRGG